MNITLFTSDKLRHNYLINLLSNHCENLFVIQEFEEKNTNSNLISKNKSLIFQNYFKRVVSAEKSIFDEDSNFDIKKNIKIKKIKMGLINNYSIQLINDYLKSDIFIIYGSSFIKGELINFLIDKKAINIHMGVSPYYRGAACNFWALYDNNPHLVGSTIHLLSKKLDGGNILYHAMSNFKSDPFIYSMSAVKSAFKSVSYCLQNNLLFKFKPQVQNRLLEIRYSKKNQFDDAVINNYIKKNIKLKKFLFNDDLLINPFYF